MKCDQLRIIPSIVCFIMLFVAVVPLRGEMADDKSYFELSLQELMDITIVTASSFDQKISEAGAIIDVYTAEQIKALGVDNLYDFMGFLPGIEVMETYYGYTTIQFRGILQAHYNNKSSLLLNGQPLFDEVISSYYLEQIPISAIKQIEVIRGPGSVLYGTNAYAGVINVITKDGESMDGSAISFQMGSFDTKKVSFAMGRQIEGIDLFFGGDYNESDGYEKSIVWDEDDTQPAAGSEGEQPYGNRTLGYYQDDRDSYENDYLNFFTSIGYRDLTLNAVVFESQKDKFGIIPTQVSTGERLIRGSSVNARYHRFFLDDKALLRGIAWYDHFNKNERVNSYPPVVRAAGVAHDQTYSGHKSGFQAQVSYPLSEALHLLGGVGFEDARSDPYLFLYIDSVGADGEPVANAAANAFTEKKKTNDLWGFVQTTLSASTKLDINAGGRFNTNEQAGAVLVPSVSVVYRPSENLSAKCLFGTGFRNPSFFEKYVQTVDVLAGDEDLEPERINTFELGIDYRVGKYSLRANAYYTKTDHMIARRALDAEELEELNSRPGYGEGSMTWSEGFVYYNSPGGVYRGLELSFQGIPAPGLSLQGNLTYKCGEDEDGNELQYFAPFHTNFSVRYSPVRPVSVTVTLNHVSEREGNYASQYDWQTWPDAEAGGTDYTLESYALLNTRIGFTPTPPIEVVVIIKNILDKEYYYPEYIRRSIPFIPGGPGRSLFVEVGYRL